MTEPDPEGEEPYELPDTQPAPNPPVPDLTAAKAAPFVPKEIG